MREAETFAPSKQELNWRTEDLADRIVLFGEELTGKELYPYQRSFAVEIITTVLDRTNKTITALFSRQSGKTEAVALVAVACAILLPIMAKAFPHDRRVGQYKNGFWVGIYAPKDELAKLAFERVRSYSHSDVAEKAYPELEMKLAASSADRVSWNTGSKVRARTASDNSLSEGDTWHLVICDESQAISEQKIDKELKPMLKATGGTMVQIGTTGGAAGQFHRRIKRNTEEERDKGDRRHFESDYKEVCRQKHAKYSGEVDRWNRFSKASAKVQQQMLERDPRADQYPDDFHLNYEKSLNEDIAEFGGIGKAEQNETFQLNYMLRWGSNSLIAVPPDAWHALAVPNMELNQGGVKGFLVAGLDLAKGEGKNADQSVLSILHIDIHKPIIDPMAVPLPGQDPIKNYMKTLIGVYTFRGDFENFQNDAVVQTIRLYPGIRRLVVDSNGMGDPVASRLANLLPNIEVEGMSWANYSNKSLCYKLYLMAIRAKHFRYFAGPTTRTMIEFKDMEEQVLGLTKKFIGIGNTMVCEAADEGGHDDHPDSHALACYAADQAVEHDANEMDTIELSDFTIRPQHNQQEQGPASRADSYRTGRRGRSRYDVHRAI